MSVTKHARLAYPKEERARSGCKVSWRYYKDEATAKRASDIAKVEARRKEELGYDFGYCDPGWVRQCGPDYWPEYAPLFEVCIP